MVMSSAVGEVHLFASLKKRSDGSAELVVFSSDGYHPFSGRVSKVPAGELLGPEADTGNASLFPSAIQDNVRDCFLALERLATALSEYRPSCH